MEIGTNKEEDFPETPDTALLEQLMVAEGERKLRVLKGAAGYDGGKAIKKEPSFQHEAMIDMILRRPRITQVALAEAFGYTPGWVNRLVNSDAFQSRIAQRRKELVDPGLARRLNARLEGVAIQSLDVITRKLEAGDSADLALEALGLTGAVASRSRGVK